MNFQERKEKRKKYYFENEYKAKLRDCLSCNGSGYYDHNGSPPCSACNGTGKEKYKPKDGE